MVGNCGPSMHAQAMEIEEELAIKQTVSEGV